MPSNLSYICFLRRKWIGFRSLTGHSLIAIAAPRKWASPVLIIIPCAHNVKFRTALLYCQFLTLDSIV